MPKSLPNILSLLRIVLIFPLLLSYYIPWPYANEKHFFTAFFFFLAAVTDFFDGFLARRLSLTSKLGAFLDPIADKLLVASSLVVLTEHFSSWVITLPSLLIILRELSVSALRAWMLEFHAKKILPVSFLGKVKTFLQLNGIFWIFVFQDFEPYGVKISIVCLYLAAIFGVISLIQYGFHAKKLSGS